ncbi:Trypsin Inhibitor-like, cysteine rich domain-containing protein [Strongyloides ratti]|uniref:Trypsin Inhibitor-like, cysteine rich domain-containing protein n=1 Tax=Strongyloides ratti TaxID=34506 RepID=A0A090LQZ5_STRRB|nr:Trypsin Inhibitor-like, cysteine rich domain-containing protein [Strongyloides ratti]CEF70601.1 Trypsin Inhibitor-like, cysteine rich domain-containing protein [Strongyloides ratti]
MYFFLTYFFLSFILKESKEFFTKTCPNNLKFLECGTNCPRKCEHGTRPIPCDKSCALNVCQCTGGLVLHNNKCIPLSECPNICDKNSTLTTCGSACPERCSDKENEIKICTKQCIVNVCECKPGYVLDDNNKCIKREDCPQQKTTTTTRKPTTTTKKPKCGKNMYFSDCPTPRENDCLSSSKTNKCGKPRCICKKSHTKIGSKCITKSLCKKILELISQE